VHGEVYTFVFERQMGVVGEYSFAISAPVGFRFKENNLPVYEFHSKDPLGRTIITLTLEQVL
jgi:hypothetical protein